MPALSYAAIAGEAEPPVAEQLVTPNALRQRRFRDRQRAALHDAREALQRLSPGVTNDENGGADR
jgi:hypothetical protein